MSARDSQFPIIDTGLADIPVADAEFEFDEVSEEEFVTGQAFLASHGLIDLYPSDFTEFGFFLPSKDGYKNFNFNGRRYMRQIYDTDSKRLLLCAARQVEKCLSVGSLVSLANGLPVPAGSVEVNDQVSCMDAESGASTTDSRVNWVSRRLRKPCVRIATRQGHFVEVAKTHGMRTWESWIEAGSLRSGDRVAVVRRCGSFGTRHVSPIRLRLTAYLIGDGSFGTYLSFTSLPGPKLDEFLGDIVATGASYALRPKEGTEALSVRINHCRVHRWLQEDGLWGHRSASKFVPSWVFDLSRSQTAIFLNRLWSTDGCVGYDEEKESHALVYCSISERLVTHVQALLWKFGIPSKIRIYVPELYKNVEDEDGLPKVAYLLRIETQAGVRKFLRDIGAASKSDGVPLPSKKPNSNRDTYPKEINKLIREICESNPEYKSKSGNKKSLSLYGAGLRLSLMYSPTPGKLKSYIDFFKEHGGFDDALVAKLERHLDTELYWDEVESVEDIGEQECVDFSVEEHHNFVANGFVTHNSTLIGNKMVSYCCLNVGFQALYVSPSNQQTKTFSKDRIQEPIETSKYLSAFTNTRLTSNVFEKKFVNRSQVRLRFAFLNADRTRGIPADSINIDEVQDIILDNIPVIEECASHSEYGLFTYSGTPKSMDNPIEYYWSKKSTQNEWAVPCKHHGTPNDSGSWHWNILGEDNIGKFGVICDACGSPIEPDDEDAQWVCLNPDIRPPEGEEAEFDTETDDKGRQKNIYFEGFRVPQLMVPWVLKKKWAELIYKLETYGRGQFYNEVLGRSYDKGTRPLTQHDVRKNCSSKLSMRHYEKVAEKYKSSVATFMGIDWGGDSDDSFTLVTLGGYMPWAPNMYSVFYAKRFVGHDSDPEQALEVICNLIEMFNVQVVGADYGNGQWPNSMLIRRFGRQKILKYQWVGNMKHKIVQDPRLGRFLVHRTEVMTDVFAAIKRGGIFQFPMWEEFSDPFASDMLNIFSEYNEKIRMLQYKRAPGLPDDTFHSLCFGFLASMLRYPRPDIISPDKTMEQPANYDDLDVGPEPAEGDD